MHLVSVVIPAYNAERWLADAIRSALEQEYPAVEVIVVDDGSTDGTPAVCRSFGEDLEYKRLERSGGGSARNAGIEIARGDMVQFLDADDFLLPTKLSVQVPLLARDPGSLVFCANRFEDGETGRSLGTRYRPVADRDPVVYVLSGVLQTAAPLHWADALRRVGGFTNGLPCAQERDLHLRLACTGVRFQGVPEVLYVVRRTRNSVSSDSFRVLDQHEGIVSRALELLRKRSALTDERAEALAGLLAKDARAYYRAGRTDSADHYVREAFAIHPSGGVRLAYGPRTRALRKLLGPERTERMVAALRPWARGVER